jgi:hypothetical protein
MPCATRILTLVCGRLSMAPPSAWLTKVYPGRMDMENVDGQWVMPRGILQALYGELSLLCLYRDHAATRVFPFLCSGLKNTSLCTAGTKLSYIP